MSKVGFTPAPGTHRHRVQQAIAHGAPEVGDVAARYLAGVATFGDRDGARALRLISDESRRVRGIGITVAPLACDDAQATEALRLAWSVRGERRLLRRMSRHGRTAAIDAFLDGLAAERQLRDLVDDLPFGSEAAVRRHLAHAIERPSRRFWEGLALSHPQILAELLRARWEAADGEGDPVTRQLTARHHARLAERVPDAALELARVLLERGIEPATAVWAELLRRRPAPSVELAIRHAAQLPAGALARRVRELAPELLARIIAEAPHLLGDVGPRVRTMSPERQRALSEAWCDASERHPRYGTYLLRYLPAGERRRAAYERWSLAARDRDGVIAATDLAALPAELACLEARRLVHEVTALGIDPRRRLAGIARYLPWDELAAAVRDVLGHPEGDMRSLALAELLANVGVYPDDLASPARALELVLARKFEQDPVRGAMLDALARWPRRVWRAEHLPAVARAIRDALDASDLSVTSAISAERLVVRLFGVDPAWAAAWLATIIQERGTLHDPNLGAKLSDHEIRIGAPHLLSIARSWARQERAPWMIGFAAGLGARLRLVDGLGELVAQARDEARQEWIGIQLTEVLSRHDPERHAATLAQVVQQFVKKRWYHALVALADAHGLIGRQQARARDRRRPVLPAPIADALGQVAGTLEDRHTDAALSILRRRAPQTFDRVVAKVLAKDESAVILPGVGRWVHRHRQDLLAPYLSERRIRGRWATGKTRWVLPFTDGFFRWTPEQAEKFASMLEAIVGDRQRDTPAVIAALSTWPAIEYASMDRLCALARDDRPAIREKAIRVLARCDAGQGVTTLLACLGDERARFAIYGLRRALFGMIPERALQLLADAPMHKVTIAKEVVRLTGELRAAGGFTRLIELAATPLHRDVRIALLRALWDHLDREPTWTIFERAVDDPDWVLASRLADIPADRLTAALDARLAALLARVIDRPEPEARIALLRRASWLSLVDRERALLAACRARLRSPYDEEVRAAVGAVLARSTEDDMPALGATLDTLRDDPRMLHVTTAALCAHDIRSRRSWQLAAAQLEAVALRDPRWSVIAIQAAASRRRASELVTAISAVAEQRALDVDAALAARDAIPNLRDEDLATTAAALAKSPHSAVRRVAVWALAHDARPGRGWTTPRLELLAHLRADPSPEVAGAASRLWPPREQDPGFA